MGEKAEVTASSRTCDLAPALLYAVIASMPKGAIVDDAVSGDPGSFYRVTSVAVTPATARAATAYSLQRGGGGRRAVSRAESGVGFFLLVGRRLLETAGSIGQGSCTGSLPRHDTARWRLWRRLLREYVAKVWRVQRDKSVVDVQPSVFDVQLAPTETREWRTVARADQRSSGDAFVTTAKAAPATSS